MPTGDNVIPFPGPRGASAPWGARGLPPRRQPEPFEPPATPATYVVRLELDHTDPPVWRRLALASHLTLDRAHEAIQAAMGWEDYHLHHFTMGPGRLDRAVLPFLTDHDVEEAEDDGVPETVVRLDQVLGQVGHRLFYEYDFGDSWHHTLTLEAIEEYDADAALARCLAGERACPPEDIGGVGTFQEVVAFHAAPGSEDLEGHLLQVLEWLPDGYDPAAFDGAAVDRALAEAVRPLPPAVDWDTLNPVLADLARRLDTRDRRTLAELVAAARLTGPGPTPADQAAATRPLLVLLDEVGTEGTPLTAAGYLKPVVVERLFTELDLATEWVGKGNREDLTPPVAQLRDTAQSLGLVRKYRGRLVRTPAGRRVAGDPAALWDHVVGRLPAGDKPGDHDAGVLALLCTAAGDRDREAFSRHAPSLLMAAGWMLPDWQRIEARDARWYAAPTYHVLEALRGGLRWREPDPAYLVALARAALTRR